MSPFLTKEGWRPRVTARGRLRRRGGGRLGQRVHIYPSLPDAQRGLQRLHHSRALGAGHAEAVLYHFQLAARLRVNARVPLLLQQLAQGGSPPWDRAAARYDRALAAQAGQVDADV